MSSGSWRLTAVVGTVKFLNDTVRRVVRRDKETLALVGNSIIHRRVNDACHTRADLPITCKDLEKRRNRPREDLVIPNDVFTRGLQYPHCQSTHVESIKGSKSIPENPPL
jgi:hypothetical protein